MPDNEPNESELALMIFLRIDSSETVRNQLHPVGCRAVGGLIDLIIFAQTRAATANDRKLKVNYEKRSREGEVKIKIFAAHSDCILPPNTLWHINVSYFSSLFYDIVSHPFSAFARS